MSNEIPTPAMLYKLAEQQEKAYLNNENLSFHTILSRSIDESYKLGFRAGMEAAKDTEIPHNSQQKDLNF